MARLTIKTAVYVLIEKDNKYLFLRRFNTGWSDGLYTLPAGHIDPGELPLESAVREMQEEVNLAITAEDLQFAHVAYEKDKYIDFYFKLKTDSETIKLCEPDKADALIWLAEKEFDSDLIIPKIRQALKNIVKDCSFSQFVN